MAPMEIALAEARAAAARDEVPVGAVVLDGAGAVLAQAGNEVEARHDPTAHAELLALRAAAATRGETRLPDCELVVTLEPCPMCAQAISLFRIRRLTFGAYDPKGRRRRARCARIRRRVLPSSSRGDRRRAGRRGIRVGAGFLRDAQAAAWLDRIGAWIPMFHSSRALLPRPSRFPGS